MNAESSGEEQKYSLDEVQSLDREIDLLKIENRQLQETIEKLNEHYSSIQSHLLHSQRNLQAEVRKRARSERSLKILLETVSKQKEDLEILIQILVDHADSLDREWQEKVVYANYLATLDALTQLSNRRGFEQSLETQWQLLLQEQSPLSLLMFDLDYFKQYNDTYGHLAGDECLRKIAILFREVFDREGGTIARYGGEEFAAILPHVELPKAVAIAEFLHSEVLKLQIPHIGSPNPQYVTISVGVTEAVPASNLSPAMLFNEADRLLYRAKQQGRNQIAFQKFVSSAPDGSVSAGFAVESAGQPDIMLGESFPEPT